MSFRCQACNIAQEPGIKPTILVVETAPAEYHCKVKSDVMVTDHKTGDLTPRYVNAVRVGTEIVREARLCPPCAKIVAPVAISGRPEAIRLLGVAF